MRAKELVSIRAMKAGVTSMAATSVTPMTSRFSDCEERPLMAHRLCRSDAIRGGAFAPTVHETDTAGWALISGALATAATLGLTGCGGGDDGGDAGDAFAAALVETYPASCLEHEPQTAVPPTRPGQTWARG